MTSPLFPQNTLCARRKKHALPRVTLVFCLCLALLPPFAGATQMTLPAPASQNAAASAPCPSSSGPADAPDPAWNPLIRRLAADGFDLQAVEDLFSRLGPESYSPAYMAAKITELYGVPGIGIRREHAPLPRPPAGYAPPIPDNTVGSCLVFIKEQAAALADIERKYGVPAPVIIAVLLIETGLGQDLGKDSALRALASMAATGTPELLASMGNSRQKARVPPASLAGTLKGKSAWAYAELKALLRYAEQRNCEPASIPGSVYGAVGLCQFMPSNIARFAVDGDNDGAIDLFRPIDAMYSVASYLEANGWRNASTDAHRIRVIRTYNDDGMYASAVLATSKRLENALAGKGKISLASSAVVGGYGGNPSARLDPSLRRIRRVSAAARVHSLGDYRQLIPH